MKEFHAVTSASRVLVHAGVFCLSIGAAIGAAAQTSPASSEEVAVLAVVDRFMIAISTNDFATLAQLRAEGSFDVIERPQAGGTLVTRRPFAPDGSKPGNFKERYWDPVVRIRGSLAVVWTPYEFWRDGKTSHCGIDVFEMFNEQGRWRIGNMMWTVEPDACPALRPGDASRAAKGLTFVEAFLEFGVDAGVEARRTDAVTELRVRAG